MALGGPFKEHKHFVAMSADGSTFVGTSEFQGDGLPLVTLPLDGNVQPMPTPRPFLLTGDKSENLSPLDEKMGSVVSVAISGDGGTVICNGIQAPGGWLRAQSLYAEPASSALRWTAAGGLTPLFTDSSTSSVASAVSADGTTIAGSRYVAGPNPRFTAFRWNADRTTDLPPLPGYTCSRASGISADGSVVAGSSSNSTSSLACLWLADGTSAPLGRLPGLPEYAEATALSADGTTVIGFAGFGEQSAAFRWSAVNGMEQLGSTPSTWPQALSADGTVVVGSANFGAGDFAAFRWDAEHGLQRLDDLLKAAGVDVQGYRLMNAIAISADGKTILGSGTAPAFLIQGMSPPIAYWVVHLPTVPAGVAGEFPQKTNGATSSGPALARPRFSVRNGIAYVRGISRGETTHVDYRLRADKEFKSAEGTSSWRFSARVRPGRTIFTVVASGPAGQSDPLRIVIPGR